MDLYLDCDDFRIIDEQGKEYTIDQAKALVAKGKMTNCNLSFQRLMSFDFDLEATKEFYVQNP